MLVVDGSGETSQALAGGLMRLAGLARGVAVFVLDGAMRDLAEWAEGELPVFARGRSPRGPMRAKQAQEEDQQRHHLASRTDHSFRARDDERVDATLRATGCPV